MIKTCLSDAEMQSGRPEIEHSPARNNVDFSLFYFADDADNHGDRYRLMMEGAQLADALGFAAVWTPERHFHRFGGLFPNPSVTAAAIAAVTTQVGVRAGSVVLPLHHPLRVAEEWAVVDNLSGGRAGLSLASGWNPGDFVLAPPAYEERRRLTLEGIDTLRRLWEGEPYIDPAGARHRVYPRPVQREPQLWLTSSGSGGTFEEAGKAGIGVLTHLLNNSMAKLAVKVARYRRAFATSGREGRGHVALMVHTYLDKDRESAERLAREPLSRYLTSSLDLNVRAAMGRASTPVAEPSPAQAKLAVRGTCERYLRRDGLFGSVTDALSVVRRIAEADVDEIACLIDFGVPTDAALAGIERVDKLRSVVGRPG
jgi:natural product biosynthesis luciferase-like monooxygenase protein